MRIVVWLVEGTWQSCIDAADQIAPADAEIVLLHVLDPGLSEGLHGVFEGRLGRGRHGPDPGDAVTALSEAAERQLFDAATGRLGRPATRHALRGQAEREVVAACVDAALLVAARDGDHSRLGPHSLAPPTRFVVDHAPCRVLLVWPDEPPSLGTMPPPPHQGSRPHRRPGHREPPPPPRGGPGSDRPPRPHH
ncbi:MAG: universal stress protein [Nocardioidaceae bacterium]